MRRAALYALPKPRAITGRRNSKQHYLVIVEGDVEPSLNCLFESEEDCRKATRRHRHSDPSLPDGLYWLTVDTSGKLSTTVAGMPAWLNCMNTSSITLSWLLLSSLKPVPFFKESIMSSVIVTHPARETCALFKPLVRRGTKHPRLARRSGV